MIGKITVKFKDYSPLVLRTMLGVIFLYHGSQKLFGAFGGPGLEGTQGLVAKIGFYPLMLWAVMLSVSEFVGGIFVLVGFLTRYAAAVLCTVMLVAIFAFHIRYYGFSTVSAGAGGWEFAFACFMASLSLVITGAGKCSIDAKAGDLKDYV